MHTLAGHIGDRSPLFYRQLEEARAYIEHSFTKSGYQVDHDVYQVQERLFRNLIVQKKGTCEADSILIIGAHYDTVPGTSGADDNASGVASLLELAQLIRHQPTQKTIRFVAFTLEEPPYFRTSYMGSWVHAKRCSQNSENITGMISLEMVGYYSDLERSQRYPLPFLDWYYPRQGDFIAVAGNWRSRRLVKKVTTQLKQGTGLPVQSISLPFVPGVGLSDNWSFWQQGYPALMITDTAFFRNPHYHLPSDRPETLNYERMTELVRGLEKVLPAI